MLTHRVCSRCTVAIDGPDGFNHASFAAGSNPTSRFRSARIVRRAASQTGSRDTLALYGGLAPERAVGAGALGPRRIAAGTVARIEQVKTLESIEASRGALDIRFAARAVILILDVDID